MGIHSFLAILTSKTKHENENRNSNQINLGQNGPNCLGGWYNKMVVTEQGDFRYRTHSDGIM
jgi:hypothetical protein